MIRPSHAWRALALTLCGAGSAMAAIEIPVVPVGRAAPAIAVEAPARPQGNAESDVPVVSRAVMTAGVPKPIAPLAPGARAPSTPLSTVSRVRMSPGVNEILPVAQHHLNRLVTPFATPTVTTTSNATTEVRNNVVYVATGEEAPVTLYITEKDNESVALSVTLIPQRIPARELFLELDERTSSSTPLSSPQAKRWETSQPYVETVKTLMRQLALGETPRGYALKDTPEHEALPRCSQHGLTFDFAQGQMLLGHNLKVFVGLAKNGSPQPVEFKEQACGEWDVAAVAAYPRNLLQPNQRTEVFVVVRNGPERNRAARRPSLLSGEQ